MQMKTEKYLAAILICPAQSELHNFYFSNPFIVIFQMSPFHITIMEEM